VIRSDVGPKVRGEVAFAVDLEVPGMLWAALVPAPVAHGRIRSLDLHAARRMPGVESVIGPEEARALLPGGGNPERPVFPPEEILYRGQPLAAIAARTWGEARAAAREVRAEIDPLPILADLDAVFPEWPAPEAAARVPMVNAHVHARHGPVDATFAAADHVRKDEFRTSGIAQLPLEPHACLAEVTGGTWKVRTSTQTPFGIREDACELLHLPETDLVVEGTWVGGGFGSKNAAILEPYALLLAAATGRSVRLAMSYREELELVRSTMPARIWVESAVVRRRLVARRVRLLLDTGASLPGRDFATGYAITFLLGPYRLDAFEVEGYGVRTHKPPFGPHRAPFAPQCTFAADGHMDALARELGEDPVEFRLRHVWRAGDVTALRQTVGPFGATEALVRARRLRDRWRAELPASVGLGVALGYWSTGLSAGGEVRLRLFPDRVEVEAGEREIGSGSVVRGLEAVAERALGIPRAGVRVTYADTAHARYDSGVFGSRTVPVLGRAIEEAAEALRAELARRIGRNGPVVLRWDAGRIVVDGGGRPAGVEELVRTEGERSLGIVADGKFYGRPSEIDAGRVVAGDFYPLMDFTAAVHLAAVEVDRGTGQVTVRRYAAFHDAGVVLDPPTFVAQVEGGVAMGLGEALTEELLWNSEGRLENPGLLDYRVPTVAEVPVPEVEAVEGAPGGGPGGAKGIGEPPVIPVPAAVANAVADATGARLRELPLTPERVARALMRQ
jgi:CO/xanthine dehydrogenase Mo-binding subunit